MRRKALLACAALIALSVVAKAQWTQTAGPQGAQIAGIAADDRRIVAVVFKDVYNYVGDQWVLVGSLNDFGGLSFAGGESLLLANGVLLAQTQSGLVRSTDFGATWRPVDFDGAITTTAKEFYAVRNDSLFRSTTSLDGADWKLMGVMPQFSGLPTVFDDDMYVSSVYGGELSRSTDGGATWSRLDATFPLIGHEQTAGQGVTFAPGSDRLYALMGGGEVFSSSDGVTWTNITHNLPNWLGAHRIVAQGNEVLINSAFGLFRFAGTQWDAVDIKMPQRLIMSSDGALVSGAGGLHLVPNGTSQTKSLNKGMIRGGAYGLGAIGSTVLATTSHGIYRTTDQGDSWNRVADFGGWTAVNFVNHKGTVYAANGVAYRSTDSGATWRMTGPKYDFEVEGSGYYSDVTGLASDGEVMYLGVGAYRSGKGGDGWEDGGVWASSDNGATWKLSSNGLPFDGFAYAPVAGIIASREYVLISTAAGVYRSTDHGRHWVPSMSGLPFDNPPRGSGEVTLTATGVYLRIGLSIYQSIDGGVTWAELSPSLPEGYEWTMPFVVDDKLQMQTYRRLSDMTFEHHLFTFDGVMWEDITSTQPKGVIFESMVRAGDYIYAGTREHGVWRIQAQRTEHPASVASIGAASGVTIAAYPNPSAGATDIRFVLPTRSSMRLTIVDMLGKEVANVVEGTLDAGEHVSRIDLRTLPVGAYVVRLRVDSALTQTKLLKAE